MNVFGHRHRRTAVKFCGITRPADAQRAAQMGVDAIGVVFASSLRRLAPARAAEVFEAAGEGVVRVGVFAGQPLEEMLEAVEVCGLDWVQLSGRERGEVAARVPIPVLKAVHVTGPRDLEAHADYPANAFLLDAPVGPGPGGGRGVPFDWSAIGILPWERSRVVVAGGLSPANVEEAIRHFRPGGVDVSSGIESAPGIKDPVRMEAFMRSVERAEAAGGSAEKGKDHHA